MITPDNINGLYESLGGLFVGLNIWRLYKDKCVKGVSIATIAFFTTWGFWNIFYYRSLDQWFSWVAGMGVALSNTVWVLQMIYYSRKNNPKETILFNACCCNHFPCECIK